MGKITNGANGAFSGKVGSVVGSNWRDVDYIRGMPKRSLKKPTDKQIKARRNFAFLAEFLGPLSRVIEQGFKNQDTRKATALNLAIQANYRMFEDTNADSFPDYTKAILSKGNLVGKPAGCSLLAAGESVIRITWDMYGYSALERGVDKATIVLYCPSLKESIISKDQYLRQDQKAEIDLRANWVEQLVCVYMFLTSMEDRNSDTVFVGSFIN